MRAGLSPLDVIWSGTDVHGNQVSGRTSDVTELAERFRDARPFRLVVQGPPGSGKSIFARRLMTELLQLDDQGPVPVFLPLWSWNPGQERLHDWMKRRIKEDCPELGDTATFGPTAVANLVDQGMVLPVLDGLDSLPRQWRAKVFGDGGVMSQDRLILTCRAGQPERADGFTVITPEPVEAGEATRFLGAVTNGSASEWALLGAAPDFATIYSEPRLIYMTSAICEKTGATPEKIVGDLSLDPHSSVEERLLGIQVDALLPGSGQDEQDYPPYYHEKGEGWLKVLAPLGLWDQVDLRHADWRKPSGRSYRDYVGVSCIAWWNLHRGVPFLRQRQAQLRAATAGVLTFLVVGGIFDLERSWPYTLLTSAAYGFMIFFAGWFLAADHPGPSTGSATLANHPHPALAWWFSRSRDRYQQVFLAGTFILVVTGLLIGYRAATIHGPHDHWRWTGFRTKLFDGLNLTLIHGREHEVWYWVGFRTGFFDGLNLALIVIFTFVIAQVPRAPRDVWAIGPGPVGRSQTRKFLSAIFIGIPFGLEWGISAVLKGQHPHVATLGQAVLTGLITGVDFAIGAWLFQWSREWSRIEHAPGPLSAARADLFGAVLRPVVLGFTFAFAFGISAPFNFTGVDVWAWFVVGLALGSLETEWPLYFVAIRALRGKEQRLPIRLMRFLDTCCVSGLLSPVGQAYQIHDDRLLELLTKPDEPAESAPSPASRLGAQLEQQA